MMILSRTEEDRARTRHTIVRDRFDSITKVRGCCIATRDRRTVRLSRDAPIRIRLCPDVVQHAMSTMPPVLANVEYANCPAVVLAVIYSRTRPKRRIIKGILQEVGGTRGCVTVFLIYVELVTKDS